MPRLRANSLSPAACRASPPSYSGLCSSVSDDVAHMHTEQARERHVQDVLDPAFGDTLWTSVTGRLLAPRVSARSTRDRHFSRLCEAAGSGTHPNLQVVR